MTDGPNSSTNVKQVCGENPTGKMENGHVTSGLANVDFESMDTIDKDGSLLTLEVKKVNTTPFYTIDHKFVCRSIYWTF